MTTIVEQPDDSRYGRIPAWLRELEFVTDGFTWLFRLMSRGAEALMTLATIYIIIETGVAQAPVGSDPTMIHKICIAIMIAAPEIILPGGFILAGEIRAHGNRAAGLLYASCWLFVLLTCVTLADVFAWKLQPTDPGFAALMWGRCVASVGYSILFRVITYRQERANTLSKKLSRDFTSQVESITATAEKKLSELTQKLSSELTSLIDQAQADRLSLASISETTEAHSITLAQLATLPGLVERQSQTMRQAMQDLRASIESNATSKPKLSLVTHSVTTEKVTSDEGELTNRQFIEDHLSKHPEARNIDVIEAGSKQGLTISQSQVSQVRKALKELSA